MAAKLSYSAVDKILQNCLSDDQTFPIKGIVGTYCLDKGKLEEHRSEIEELLDQLPTDFKESKGGGASFLTACYDKYGNHWGEHLIMEALFVLGMAIDRVQCLVPREAWYILPGSMPYYVIKDSHENSEQSA